MLRVAYARCNHNPKRKRGIALLTIRAEICVLSHDVELGDEVEDSTEESLADASGYERSRAANPSNVTQARG